jgi:hypothetical protein
VANPKVKGGAVVADGEVAQVRAGTTQPVATFRVIALNGTFREYPATPLFKAGVDVQLGEEEGEVIFVDVNDPKQLAKKLKLENPKDVSPEELKLHPSRVHPSVLFFAGKIGSSSGKYGGLVACEDCPAEIRKWTSDMHQSGRCMVCGIKAKRKHASAKRAAKSSPVASAAPATTPTA